VALDLAKTIPELLTKLLDRGHLLWWPLAIGSLLGFAVLAALSLTGPPPFLETDKTVSLWLLIASIIFGTLAVVKHYQDRTAKTVKLFPDKHQSMYHGPVKQPDGSLTTQITIDFQVFNITDKLIWLPDVTLIRPRSHAPFLNKMVALKGRHGRQYELSPHSTAGAVVHITIQADLTKQIARKGVIVSIKDQFGHGHKIKLPKIRKSS